MSQCKNSVEEDTMMDTIFMEVQSDPMSVGFEQNDPREEDWQNFRYTDFRKMGHNHEDWTQVMTAKNKFVLNPIKSDYLRSTTPSFNNVIRSLKDNGELGSNSFVTCYISGSNNFCWIQHRICQKVFTKYFRSAAL